MLRRSRRVLIFLRITDRASTIPSNIRGCQSGTWSTGKEKIRGTSTKSSNKRMKTKQNKTKTRQKRQKERNNDWGMLKKVEMRSDFH